MPDHFSPADLAGWLSYLERLHAKPIELGLERVDRVRERMGLKPDFPVITVAGTNGKGSTCAMLERILTESGYRVGCYTSPHLLRYNERVRVGCTEAEDAMLCEAFVAVENARGDIPLTYFEYGTLAAVWLFVSQKVDVAVLEIGLGGRLDAVNVFEPSCAVVTGIDLDHLDYLGNSRESIGFEKAGIFRPGIPAICGTFNPPHTVPEHARRIAADYRQIGTDFGFTVEEAGELWSFWSKDAHFKSIPLPALCGEFQFSNAACVLESLMVLKDLLPVSRAAICAGFTKVNLAGRFQKFSGPPQVILDVAHNPQAARGLAVNLRAMESQGKTLAVFAMLNDKDISGVLQEVGQVIDAWFVAGIEAARGTTKEQMMKAVNANLPDARVEGFDSISNAFSIACREAGENDRIVAFGSFYTVADVMRAMSSTERT